MRGGARLIVQSRTRIFSEIHIGFSLRVKFCLVGLPAPPEGETGMAQHTFRPSKPLVSMHFAALLYLLNQIFDSWRPYLNRGNCQYLLSTNFFALEMFLAWQAHLSHLKIARKGKCIPFPVIFLIFRMLNLSLLFLFFCLLQWSWVNRVLTFGWRLLGYSLP